MFIENHKSCLTNYIWRIINLAWSLALQTIWDKHASYSSSHLTRNNFRHTCIMHRAFCLPACNQFAQRQIPKESFLCKVESNSNLITEHIVCSMICYLMQIHKLISRQDFLRNKVVTHIWVAPMYSCICSYQNWARSYKLVWRGIQNHVIKDIIMHVDTPTYCWWSKLHSFPVWTYQRQ